MVHMVWAELRLVDHPGRDGLLPARLLLTQQRPWTLLPWQQNTLLQWQQSSWQQPAELMAAQDQ
jgi:hypothetical protein